MRILARKDPFRAFIASTTAWSSLSRPSRCPRAPVDREFLPVVSAPVGAAQLGEAPVVMDGLVPGWTRLRVVAQGLASPRRTKRLPVVVADP